MTAEKVFRNVYSSTLDMIILNFQNQLREFDESVETDFALDEIDYYKDGDIKEIRKMEILAINVFNSHSVFKTYEPYKLSEKSELFLKEN